MSKKRTTSKNKAKAKGKSAEIVTSQAELARALGRHTRTVADYLAKGMPGERGRYDVAACRSWISNNIRTARADEDAPAGTVNAELRKTELAIKQQELETKQRQNQEQRGELYVANDVEFAAVELTNRIRNRLLQLPLEVAQSVPTKFRRMVREQTDNVVRRVLIEMSNWEPIETPSG